MLAAFETHLRKNAKDDSDWRRMEAQLMAVPKEVRDRQRREAQAGRTSGPARGGMSMGDAQVLMARFAASEKQYG